MDIDDIIKKKFKDLDKFLTDEMYKTAGNDLIKIMIRVLGKEYARDWYFSKATGLNYERPYDYCRQGKQKEVEKLLGRIEDSVVS